MKTAKIGNRSESSGRLKRTFDYKPKDKARRGIAMMLVLIFSMILLTMGGVYIKTISNVKKTNPKLLEQVQSDFFGQGIARIAVLKFKKYPADFYHAFLRKVAKDKGTPPLPTLSPATPEPIDSFLGAAGTVLQNQSGIVSPASMTLDSYSTEYRLITHKAYNKDGLEVSVNMQVNGLTRTYKTTFEASRSRIL